MRGRGVHGIGLVGYLALPCAVLALAFTGCGASTASTAGTAALTPTATTLATTTTRPASPTPVPAVHIDPALCAESTPTPPSPLATPQPIPVSGWATYTNTAYHYTITYPANWHVVTSSGTTSTNFYVENSFLQGGSGPYPPYPLNRISVDAFPNPDQLSAAEFNVVNQHNNGPLGPPPCSQDTHAVTVAGRSAIQIVQHPIHWQNGLIDYPSVTYYVPDGTTILILSEAHSPGGQPSDVLTHMLASLTISG